MESRCVELEMGGHWGLEVGVAMDDGADYAKPAALQIVPYPPFCSVSCSPYVEERSLVSTLAGLAVSCATRKTRRQSFDIPARM